MEAPKVEAIPFIGLYEARLVADYGGGERWTVRVALRDRRGALAAIAGAFAGARVAVCSARIATGPAQMVIDVFEVRASEWTDWEAVRAGIEAALVAGYDRIRLEPVEVAVRVGLAPGGHGSIVEVRGADRVGLLARVAGAMARAGLEIRQATITTEGLEAIDTFEVTGRAGGPMTPADERALIGALAGKKVRRGIGRTTTRARKT